MWELHGRPVACHFCRCASCTVASAEAWKVNVEVKILACGKGYTVDMGVLSGNFSVK